MEMATRKQDPREEALMRGLWLQGFLVGLVPINHPGRRVVADSIGLMIGYIENSIFTGEHHDQTTHSSD